MSVCFEAMSGMKREARCGVGQHGARAACPVDIETGALIGINPRRPPPPPAIDTRFTSLGFGNHSLVSDGPCRPRAATKPRHRHPSGRRRPPSTNHLPAIQRNNIPPSSVQAQSVQHKAVNH
jgi:hypothetical protein